MRAILFLTLALLHCEKDKAAADAGAPPATTTAPPATTTAPPATTPLPALATSAPPVIPVGAKPTKTEKLADGGTVATFALPDGGLFQLPTMPDGGWFPWLTPQQPPAASDAGTAAPQPTFTMPPLPSGFPSTLPSTLPTIPGFPPPQPSK